MKQQRKREVVTLVVVFTGVLLVSALAVYYIGNRRTGYTPVEQPGQVAQDRPRAQDRQAAQQSAERPVPPPTPAGDESFLDELLGGGQSEVYVRRERWVESMGRVSLRLLLAALLAAALAFRPRKRILALKRNPYVS